MLSLRTDRSLARAGARSTRFVTVSLRAPQAPQAPRRARRLPINVALVLDRSGSMGDARKFELAREATERALMMLSPEDRFSLVVYDQELDVLTRSTLATPAAKEQAIDALRKIHPRGGTDLCGGWMRGCEQVADHLVTEGVARVLLLTDGLANHGVTDRHTLARHAAELRRRGVSTSTFGVGADFDEQLLRDMAHEGGGNFYFIEGAAQIPELLSSELGEALEVVVRNARLEVDVPRGADAEPLNRFRFDRTTPTHLTVELGDLCSGQEVQVVIRVELPRGEVGDTTDVRVTLVGTGELFARDQWPPRFVSWTYAGHAENDRQARDREVDRQVATLYAARARAEATDANRHGDWSRARRVLERTADRIARFAGDDPVLRRLARDLRREVPDFAERAMSPVALKSMMFAAENVSKFRQADGKARR